MGYEHSQKKINKLFLVCIKFATYICLTINNKSKMNTTFTSQQIAENMETFDFNTLFNACEAGKKLDFSTPQTIVKKESKPYVSNLPESCIQLNGLRQLSNALGWA